jgi:hypothetical protein
MHEDDSLEADVAKAVIAAALFLFIAGVVAAVFF